LAGNRLLSLKRVLETHGPKTSHPKVSQKSRKRQKTGGVLANDLAKEDVVPPPQCWPIGINETKCGGGEA
jgi:hypothetical protein